MVATSVLVAIVFKGLLVGSEGRLLESEGVLARSHLAKGLSTGRLEGLVGLERVLEVHPVLGCTAKSFLVVGGLVAYALGLRNKFVIGYKTKWWSKS